ILLSFLLTIRLPPSSTLFPYTTLFRSLTPSPSLRRSYHAAASTTSSSASGRTTRRQVIGLSASVCEPSTLRAVSTNQDQRDGLRISPRSRLHRQQTAAAHQVRQPS